MPLYHQLKERMMEQIENGTFRSGEPLPTEMSLTQSFKVSRVTVRRALDELVQDGFIYRIAGKGTFVLRNKVKREISQMTSFSQDMHALGQSISSKILEFKKISAPPLVAERMQIPEKTKLIYVHRLRLVDDQPVAISISYLHLPGGISISRVELEQARSLWLLMENKGIMLREVQRTIEAVAADAERAGLLSLPVGAPLLLMEGVTFSNNSHPIEFYQVISRGDRYKYSTTLSR